MNYQALINSYTKNELLNYLNVFPILKYLETNIGYEKMVKTIEPLGLQISYLLTKNNFVSFEYYLLLLEKLTKVTDDKDAALKSFSKDFTFYILKDFLDSNYPINLFLKYKNHTSLIINFFLEKRLGKIFDFKIIKKNYFLISLHLKSYNKNNILFYKTVKGFLNSIGLYLGLENLIIKHLKFNSDKKLKITFKMLFSKTKNQDTLKEKSMIEIINEIQKENKNHLEKEQELYERNKYLTVLNKIRKAINISLYFDPILFEASTALINDFYINNGLYFQYSFKDEAFRIAFDFSGDKVEENDFNKINQKKLKFSLNDYQNLKKLKFPITNLKLNNFMKIYDPDEIPDASKIFYIYFLKIEISEEYFGFFLFFSNKKKFNDKIINELFENIEDQLKLAYDKISSRYVIENILSSIPAYVIIFKTDTFEIKYVNNKFISLFPGIQKNLTKEDIIGKDLFSILFDNENSSRIKNYIKNLSSKHSFERFELTIGTNVFEYNLFQISLQNQQTKLAGIIINDITEAKYFQQHLLNNEKLLALGRVASGIAHEINNPLYAVLSNAEEISENENQNPETKRYAEEIIDHVINVSNIIKDLSIYSKSLRKEDFDNININNVIEESLKLVKYSSNFLEVEIIKNFSELPAIKALKGEMQQVFINLFNNAIQAMNGKGTLKISTMLVNNTINISISDNGSGIPKGAEDHIFELFFTTKDPGKGTGLGLHIVKKIIDRYNGIISFESIEGKGTTFYLKFNVS